MVLKQNNYIYRKTMVDMVDRHVHTAQKLKYVSKNNSLDSFYRTCTIKTMVDKVDRLVRTTQKSLYV